MWSSLCPYQSNWQCLCWCNIIKVYGPPVYPKGIHITRREGSPQILPRWPHLYSWLLLRWLIGKWVTHLISSAKDCPATLLAFSTEQVFSTVSFLILASFAIWIDWEPLKAWSAGSFLLNRTSLIYLFHFAFYFEQQGKIRQHLPHFGNVLS